MKHTMGVVVVLLVLAGCVTRTKPEGETQTGSSAPQATGIFIQDPVSGAFRLADAAIFGTIEPNVKISFAHRLLPNEYSVHIYYSIVTPAPPGTSGRYGDADISGLFYIDPSDNMSLQLYQIKQRGATPDFKQKIPAVVPVTETSPGSGIHHATLRVRLPRSPWTEHDVTLDLSNRLIRDLDGKPTGNAQLFFSGSSTLTARPDPQEPELQAEMSIYRDADTGTVGYSEGVEELADSPGVFVGTNRVILVFSASATDADISDFLRMNHLHPLGIFRYLNLIEARPDVYATGANLRTLVDKLKAQKGTTLEGAGLSFCVVED